jgi:hypothetical protein
MVIPPSTRDGEHRWQQAAKRSQPEVRPSILQRYPPRRDRGAGYLGPPPVCRHRASLPWPEPSRRSCDQPNWHGQLAGGMKTMQIQEWLDKIQRPDGTKLKIKNVLSAIFSHGVRWELVERNPVCGQGGSPGHRGASTGVRQSNRVSIRRVALAPDVVRQTLEQLPLREATMAL